MALARVVCPSLIGRDEEMSLLEDALLAALRGDGGVVVVGGDAGMGKSRLVAELRQRAVRLGSAVMSGACSEAELSLPYLPFLEAIGNHLSTQDLAPLRDRLGSAADELAQLFPQMGRSQPAGADPMQAKLRLFEAMLLLLADAARGRGLLLILEDLHWADPATRELIDYATRRLRSTNVLVLATYRTDELHRKHALLPTIQGWRRSGQAQLIEIGPLRPQGVKAMVMSIFDEADLSDEFRDFMFQRSEGNPFVIEEMLRDAIDRGDIFRTDMGWDRKAVRDMRMPRTVRDTILARLESLNPEQVEVLSAASALGQTFDVPTLVAVTGRGRGEVLSALEACVTHQLLEDADVSGRYGFRHALTREAVYEDMLVPRRQQLHMRIAEVLESRPDSKPVDLAHHLLAAGSYEQAVGMCVAAANAALSAHAYRDAADLFERAIPHVSDVVERSRLMCRAGEAYSINGEVGTARKLLEQGIADLDAAGLADEAARNRLILGRTYWELQRPDLAREQFTRARDVLEAAGPSEALAIAYIRLSGLEAFDMGGDAGLADALRAAEIAREVDSTMALAWSWNFVGLAKTAKGQIEEGFRFLEDSREAAVKGDHYFQQRNANYNATWIAVHIGYGHVAARWLERMLDTMAGESWLNYMRGLVVLHQGDVAGALRLARLAQHESRQVGNEKNLWRANVLTAQALAESDRADQAEAELPPVSTRVEGQDTIYDLAARVRTRLAANDEPGAVSEVREVAPKLTELGSPAEVIAEAAMSDAGWLRSFLDMLPNQDVQPPLAAHEAARGRLALAEGRFQDAVRLLGQADAWFRKEGFLLDAWHADRALVEAMFRAGDTTGAAHRLMVSLAEMDTGGARLAARLARETAARLGIDTPLAPEVPSVPTDIGSTGERMVSVLFADVRGYTELSGASAPAPMADRIASLQRWASQEVERQRGIIDKFAGDAVMATFNVSGQSVDHALHAVQAAIAIIDKAALAGLPVGAGIAVGPAVVGRLAESANVSVLGDVTNLAARLQSTAAAGEVALSEEAHRRVRDWLDEHGHHVERVDLSLKGFDGAVPTYRFGVRAGIRA